MRLARCSWWPGKIKYRGPGCIRGNAVGLGDAPETADSTGARPWLGRILAIKQTKKKMLEACRLGLRFWRNSGRIEREGRVVRRPDNPPDVQMANLSSSDGIETGFIISSGDACAIHRSPRRRILACGCRRPEEDGHSRGHDGRDTHPPGGR